MNLTWNPAAFLLDIVLLVVMSALTGSIVLGFLGVLAAYVVVNVRRLIEP